MASFLLLFRGNGSVMGIRGSLCGGCEAGCAMADFGTLV